MLSPAAVKWAAAAEDGLAETGAVAEVAADLEAGRAFLSPGAYFAWRAQLETLAAEGRRNVMEGLEVRHVEPLRVVHGRVFDDLTVRIAAASG